jgi:hypothetical protein
MNTSVTAWFYLGYFVGRWTAQRPDLVGEPAGSVSELIAMAHVKGWAV